jgi:phosphoribosyl-ATP pyrophosphohydrolase
MREDAMTAFTLDALERIVSERAEAYPSVSYTRQLLDQGVAKCAKKLGEEGVETALAVVAGERETVVTEAADLVYHLMVALESRGIKVSEVLEELSRRTARSGLAEKAARRPRTGPSRARNGRRCARTPR